MLPLTVDGVGPAAVPLPPLCCCRLSWAGCSCNPPLGAALRLPWTHCCCHAEMLDDASELMGTNEHCNWLQTCVN